jgi:ABC-type sugar transport system permease subunit
LLGNLIENAMIQQGNYGYGSAIALVMVAMIVGFLYILRKVDRAHGGHTHEQT